MNKPSEKTRHAGKIALVTGAAQGLGQAIACRLALEGATVALVDQSAELCSITLAQIKASDGQAFALGADLRTHTGNAQVVEQILQRSCAIDIAVLNVGGTIWAQPFWEYKAPQIEDEISRSLWPTLWGCHTVIPVMLKQNRGAIVTIGSTATRWSLRAPYAAAKGGVHAFTAALARDLAQSPVRVNCVSPGALVAQERITSRNLEPQTEQQQLWRREAYDQSVRDTPIGRPGEPTEVTGAVSFLASEDASYITGQVLYVAGGAVG